MQAEIGRQRERERETVSQREREKMSDARSSEWASFFFLFISGGFSQLEVIIHIQGRSWPSS